MEKIKRYAVYYAPPAGALWDRASAWLGWDAATGKALTPPDLGYNAHEITHDPRKYGFHATIKPPFRLADGYDQAALHHAMQQLCARLAPVVLEGLQLAQIGGFLALVPIATPQALQDMAAEVVRALDGLRAPLNAAEYARRRPETLSPRQKELLDLWGYPYVMEEFRLHMTLSDKLPPDTAAALAAVLQDHFDPVLPRPFTIGDLCLFGEAEDGRFHLLHRYALFA